MGGRSIGDYRYGRAYEDKSNSTKKSIDAKEYTTISDDEIALNVLKLAKHRTNIFSGSRKKVITEEPLPILHNLKDSNMSDEKKKIRPNKVPKKVKGLLNKLQ